MKASFLCYAFFFITIALHSLVGFCVTPPQIQDTTDPSLFLTSPIDGVTWYADHTHDILWSASDTHLGANGIILYYSLDGGANYYPLTGQITNSGIYPLAIPHFQVADARIRVVASDTYGNTSQRTNSIIVSFVPPRQVLGLQLSIAGGTDTLLSWQEVTQSVLGEAMTPDGYMLFRSADPYAPDEDFILLDTTNLTSLNYPEAALEVDRMFYKVLAYKNYRRSMDSILKEATPGKNLAEIKIMLQSDVREGGK